MGDLDTEATGSAAERRLRQLEALYLRGPLASRGQAFSVESLVDLMIILYDECCNSSLRKEKTVSDFLEYDPELQALSLNSASATFTQEDNYYYQNNDQAFQAVASTASILPSQNDIFVGIGNIQEFYLLLEKAFVSIVTEKGLFQKSRYVLTKVNLIHLLSNKTNHISVSGGRIVGIGINKSISQNI
ncbi:unnamed protein product [Ceutorhynchus assimilis]|uniref:Uncharacterized protein n=1 Tax=Ceutorhynchus assimilis TaxID=467358 RepID=A0A9N9QEG6_9CUCU|nr:unnamed protein product [Ceutorhynchus assimilis]